jgi:urocanate hydratase
MSGAQPKAVEIAIGVGILPRWTNQESSVALIRAGSARSAPAKRKPFRSPWNIEYKQEIDFDLPITAIIVDLLQYAASFMISMLICSPTRLPAHAVYYGGYCRKGSLLNKEARCWPMTGRDSIPKSTEVCKTHFKTDQNPGRPGGLYFFDYGNSFMKAGF